MERNYETVCIVKPDAGEDGAKGIIQKATSSIESGNGKVVRVDEWGRKRLAYPIQKKNEGYYFVLSYTSAPDVSKELERTLRINEDILRYQTIQLKEFITPKAAPAEAAPAEATEAAATTEAPKEEAAEETKVAEEGGKNE